MTAGRGGRAGRIAALALALVLTAGFVALGVWQLERRTWKLDLIAHVEARLAAAPVAAPADAGPDDAYRRVTLTGRFAGPDTLVKAVTERGGGFWVLTPLATDAGTVLVNRGFVPPERRDEPPPAGATTVVGLLRLTEPGGGFLRANDPAAGRWYSRDVAAIAASLGIDAAPYFVDAQAGAAAGDLPVEGLTVVAFRNSHLVYALTWFALAGMSLAAAALLLRREPRPVLAAS